MKTPQSLLIVFASLLLAAGCSTVQSRISQHQAAYASWPPPVQQKVSAGQIALGFTPEMVRVALGDPDRVFSRMSPTGRYEVWSYGERGPRWSIGVGMGTFHGRSGYGGGVNMVSPGYPGERTRVIFDQSGHVSSIEEVRRG